MKRNRKKIVIVSLYGIGNAGGVERVNYYLNEILREKYDVRILQKTRYSLGKLDILIQPVLMAMRLCLIRNKFVISNSWHSSLYPVDISIHHGTTLGFCKKTHIKFSLGARWISFWEMISGKMAKKVLCVSENGKNEIVKLYNVNEKKIYVLNNFVDENSFYVQRKNRVTQNVTILFSGRLGVGKGLEDLFRLSNFIEKQNSDDFVIRIATNDKGEAEKFKNNKKTEILIGLTKENMLTFYNSGDVLYFPTLYEGFSMATLESLSCGIPVVGSSFAIPDEMLEMPFCKRIDNSASVEMICKTIFDLKKEFSEKRDFIHEEISKKFGRRQYEEKLFALVNSLIDGR